MKRKSLIVGATMSAVLFGSIAVGSTLALYSSRKTVSNHIRTGNMHAMFYLTGLTQDYLTADGLIQTEDADLTTYEGYDAEEQAVDLSIYTGKLFQGVRVVPTMTGSANFKIVNTGDVAFTYSISIINAIGKTYDEEAGEYVDNPNAEILDQISYKLTDATYDDNPVLAHGNKTFSLSYEFLNDEDDQTGEMVNNDAMDQILEFDIQVVCTQVVKG